MRQVYDTYRQLRLSDFKHEIGHRTRQGDSWIVEAEAGQVGYLVYGPNVPMPPGGWATTFRVGAENGAPPGAVVASLEVVSGSESKPITSREVTLAEISANGALTALVLPFELAGTEMGVQFRLHSTGQVALRAELDVSVQGSEARRQAPAVGFANVDDTTSSGPEPEAEASPGSEAPVARRGFGRSLARAILWPIRRFVDPRVAGLGASDRGYEDHLLNRRLLWQSRRPMWQSKRWRHSERQVK